MNSNSKSARSGRLLFLVHLVLLTIPILYPLLSYAALDPTELRGIDALVSDPGASPVYGFTLLKTSLENRRYLGNTGKKVEGVQGLECTDPDNEIEDCPQDQTAAWIKRLFTTRPGAVFGTTNQIPSDIVSHLTPQMIGQLLQRISEMSDSDWAESPVPDQMGGRKGDRNLKRLEADLSAILFNGLNPDGIETQLKSLHKAREKEEKKGRDCNPGERDSLVDQIHAFQMVLERAETSERGSPDSAHSESKSESSTGVHSGYNSAEGRISPDSAGTHSDTGPGMGSGTARGVRLSPRSGAGATTSIAKTKIGKMADYKALAALLVGALKESRREPAHYPKHLPEQVLLAFFIDKAKGKEDLVSLFHGMPKLIKDRDFLSVPQKQEAFIQDKWKASDYQPATYLAHPADAAKDLTEHPEKLAFAMMQERGDVRSYPEDVSTGTVVHPKDSFSDCGESSVRGFFNILLFDPTAKKFNPEILDQLEKKHPEIHFNPKLKAFYEKYQDVTDPKKPEPRQDWGLLVSEHPGVQYRKGGAPRVCEIDAGVDNMMAVIDRLIFSGEGGTPPGLPSGSLRGAADRASKLDLLCKLFSREGKRLSWRVQGAAAAPESEEQSRKSLNGTSA